MLEPEDFTSLFHDTCSLSLFSMACGRGEGCSGIPRTERPLLPMVWALHLLSLARTVDPGTQELGQRSQAVAEPYLGCRRR